MAGHIAAPLKQRVYQELKARIERGELAQGEKIGRRLPGGRAAPRVSRTEL